MEQRKKTLIEIQLKYMMECRFIWPWSFEAWHMVVFPGLYPQLEHSDAYESFRRALFWWMLNGGRSAQLPAIPPEVLEHARNYRPHAS
jgi:hypothetical protein